MRKGMLILVILFCSAILIKCVLSYGVPQVMKNFAIKATLLTPSTIQPCDSIQILVELTNKSRIIDYQWVLNKLINNKSNEIILWTRIEKMNESGKWNIIFNQGSHCPKEKKKSWEVGEYPSFTICENGIGTYRLILTLEIARANPTKHKRMGITTSPIIINVFSPLQLRLEEKKYVFINSSTNLQDIVSITLTNTSENVIVISNCFYQNTTSRIPVKKSLALLYLDTRGSKPDWNLNLLKPIISYSNSNLFTLKPGTTIDLLSDTGFAEGRLEPFEHPVQNNISVAAAIDMRIVSNGKHLINRNAHLRSNTIMLDLYKRGAQNRTRSIFGAPTEGYSNTLFKYIPEGGAAFIKITGIAGALPEDIFLELPSRYGRKVLYTLEGLERWPLTLCNKNFTIEGVLTNSLIDVSPYKTLINGGIFKNPVIATEALKLPPPAYYNADKRFSKHRIESDLKLSSQTEVSNNGKPIIITSILTNRSQNQYYLIFRPQIQPDSLVPGIFYEAQLEGSNEWEILQRRERKHDNMEEMERKKHSMVDTFFLAPGASVQCQEYIANLTKITENGIYLVRVHYAYRGNLTENRKTSPLQTALDTLIGIPNFDIVSMPVEVTITGVSENNAHE